ncbi:putative ribonuclease H-like domain-containing protein [Tanacetum coccineum]
MPNLEEIVYSDDDEEVVEESEMNNLAIIVPVSPIPTTRVHKDYSLEQIIGDIHSSPQTRRMTKNVTKHVEPKKVIQALTYPSWIEAMQDELLQFKLQKVWTLVDLPYGKMAIGTKWVYKNKKNDKGIVVRNKARLVAQGYTQKEGIYYDEVFAPVARIEATRLFLAYASFMNFTVYQMDVKSAFLYGIIEEEVYVCQPPGFEDPEFPNKVYKVYVDDIIFGSTKKSLCTEFEQMMHKRFQMSSIRELTFFLGLQVKQKDDGIFISQDKYVADILKKFDFATVKTTNTLMETNKALLKDKEAADVDVHLYRSMIGSLMYLTASRPDIMFAVCTCARFQVTPKTSHLHDVKRIFRYLKGHPKLGLWYPRDLPFDLEAFSDSDYAGASLDRKSTIGGYQFLGRRLISWQCKKQTIVANSTTEAKYVAAANCRRQNGTTAKDEFQVSAVRVTYYWQVYLMLLVAFNSVVKIKMLNQSSKNETVIKEWEDRMERAATTASSLEAKQDSEHRRNKWTNPRARDHKGTSQRREGTFLRDKFDLVGTFYTWNLTMRNEINTFLMTLRELTSVMMELPMSNWKGSRKNMGTIQGHVKLLIRDHKEVIMRKGSADTHWKIRAPIESEES